MEEISDHFMYKSIKKLRVNPTKENIKRLQELVQENGDVTPFELDGGKNGCLGLAMKGSDYIITETEHFI